MEEDSDGNVVVVEAAAAAPVLVTRVTCDDVVPV